MSHSRPCLGRWFALMTGGQLMVLCLFALSACASWSPPTDRSSSLDERSRKDEADDMPPRTGGRSAGVDKATGEQTSKKSSPVAPSDDEVSRARPPAFSANSTADHVPAGWSPWLIHRNKRPTRYSLVRDADGIHLKAEADRSASGLTTPLAVDPLDKPWIEWRWRADRMIEGADNADPSAEDSPLRVVLAFEGDLSALPMRERMFAERVKLLTGRDMPYATLMYIWENRRPTDTVIPNPHTTRVQKIVVDSGPEKLKQWRVHRRNYRADYERVFGKPPGRLIGIGVMTDTDNTGTSITAYYGDIHLRRETELSTIELPAR